MNLFKIVPNRTNKRKQKERPYQDAGAVLLFVFLLPYVISCLWGHVGKEAESFSSHKQEENNLDTGYTVILSGDWGTRTVTMKDYLIRRLASVMPQEEEGTVYEEEALKAQAVLLRTELLGLMQDDGQQTDKTIVVQNDMIGYDLPTTVNKDILEQYEQAVVITDGIILVYDGEPVKAAYFAVSNGQTRNGAYPYLKSVECRQDILASDFQSEAVFHKPDFERLATEILKVSEKTPDWEEMDFFYDDAGYVSEVTMGTASCSGETFRHAFGLNSACFEAEWQGENVVFHVKGVGHGFGMSQYGANQRALQGETFDEILNAFFFETELVKIE